MTKVTTKAFAKVAAVATGLAMATSMLSLAPIAHAAVSSCTFTKDYTIGSSGAGVMCLQQALIANGYSIPAGATGYFGMQTKAAVMAWQAASGVSPAAGYFGPISRAAFNLGGGSASTGGSTSSVPGCAAGAMFSATTGQACTTTTGVAGCAPGAMFSATTGQACGATSSTSLTGTGRLINVNYLGDITTDVKESDSPKAVIGVSADAVGGDVAVQRVDATFTISNSGSQSSSLDQYVSDVSVWLGDTKLASMSPTSGDKSGRVWTLRFSGLNGVIKSGTTGNIHVKVTPLTSIGTNEDGKTVTAALLTGSVRAVGADGISDTYVTRTGSSNDSGFTVSSMTTGTLTVSAGADNPKASQVAVSSSTTTGVKLLTFSLKAKNQNVKITDLAVMLNTSDNNLNDVINTVYLMQGSTVLSSKTVTTGAFGTTTFTTLNRTIAKDATENYWIAADLKGDSAYPDNTTVMASTTVAGWDVSDAGGATVNPSASAQGNAITLTATGISLVKGTPSTTTTVGLSGAGDSTQYTIPFTVTAGDTTVFIGSTVTRVATAATVPSASAGGVTFATTTSSTASTTGTATTNFAAADSLSGDTTSAFIVNANTSRTFTLNVSFTATGTGFTGVQLVGVNYGPTSTLGTTYYTSGLDSFKTADIRMQMR